MFALIIGLCFISQINYLRLLYFQSALVLDKRIIVLNVRMATIVPLYSIVMVAGYGAPQALPILDALLALIEGFSVYCFFKMIVLSAESHDQIIKTLKDSDYTQPCCYSCQKDCTGCCYSTMYLALWQFFIIRPIFVLIDGIAELKGVTRIFEIFTILAIICLIIAMASLIRMYQTIGSIGAHLHSERKILFVKGIILLMIIQTQILMGAFTTPR
jgi:hypothetical protein